MSNVFHSHFGRGEVLGFSKSGKSEYITVLFPSQNEKRFCFPDAFEEGYLRLEVDF